MADSEANPVKTPAIIMKVEGPVEESSKEENEENENSDKIDIRPSQICSPLSKPILQQSKLGTNPFATTNSLSSSILRPSQLGARSSNAGTAKGTFSLNPSRLNPFSKTSVEDSSDSEATKKQNISQANGDTPKFVPLLLTDNKSNESPVKPPVTVSTASLSSSSNFVFGQNLQDRVVADSKADDPEPSTSCLNSNGTTEMLFTSAIKDKPKETPNSTNKETKSLSESAREYEESRANKRKYEEVEVKTGEEEETNIMQISCKLFSFDKSSGSWQERGRGNLRLNDFEITGESESEKRNCVQSRLVFRTSGSLRVILNTKIWAEMTVDLASTKSVRLTALDNNGEIKVFLIMGNQEEVTKLHKLLLERVDNEKGKLQMKKLATDSGGQC